MAGTNPTQTGAAATSRNDRTQPRTQKITTFLWFDNNAEEAANFYVSIFKNSKVLNTARYGEAGPGPKGSVMTIGFQLDGQEYTAFRYFVRADSRRRFAKIAKSHEGHDENEEA